MGNYKNPKCRSKKAVGGAVDATPMGDMTMQQFKKGGCTHRQRRMMGGPLLAMAGIPLLAGGIRGAMGAFQPQSRPAQPQMQQPQMPQQMGMRYPSPYEQSMRQPRFKSGGSVLSRMRKCRHG